MFDSNDPWRKKDKRRDRKKKDKARGLDGDDSSSDDLSSEFDPSDPFRTKKKREKARKKKEKGKTIILGAIRKSTLCFHMKYI